MYIVYLSFYEIYSIKETSQSFETMKEDWSKRKASKLQILHREH